MKLVLEVRNHNEGDAPVYHAVNRFPFKIGRGYDNDVIIGDIYADARHAEISQNADGGIVIRDMGSKNGIGPGKRREAALASGDSFTLGRTSFRIFASSHAVEPAHILQKASRAEKIAAKPGMTWALFGLAVATVTGWAWFQIWDEDVAKNLAYIGGGAAFAIMLWAGAWSAGGRLVRRKGGFSAHVVIASLYLLLSAVCEFVQSYISYLSSEGTVSSVTDYIFNFALMLPLFSESLRIASDMTPRRRKRAALFLTIGLLLGSFLFGIAAEKSFRADPSYASTLQPYLTGIAPKSTPAEFLEQNKALFDKRMFNKKP